MPTRGDAFRFLEERGPSLFSGSTSMLYVGHRGDTSPWWHATFAPVVGASRLAVLDLLPENARTAEQIAREIFVGDVRDPSAVPHPFDLVFWDEGPEHLPREESLATISALRARHRQVLVSCPWGLQPQGRGPDDPEFHHWGPQPDDFLGIGLEARTFGEMFTNDAAGHRGHGNLIAWSPLPTG